MMVVVGDQVRSLPLQINNDERCSKEGFAEVQESGNQTLLGKELDVYRHSTEKGSEGRRFPEEGKERKENFDQDL